MKKALLLDAAAIAGKKRFDLVQKDSKYDKRNGFSVLVK